MVDLKLHMEDREAMLAEKEEYIAHLEGKLTKATSNSLFLEGQLQGFQVQLNTMEERAVAIEEKAIIATIVIEATKKDAPIPSSDSRSRKSSKRYGKPSTMPLLRALRSARRRWHSSSISWTCMMSSWSSPKGMRVTWTLLQKPP